MAISYGRRAEISSVICFSERKLPNLKNTALLEAWRKGFAGRRGKKSTPHPKFHLEENRKFPGWFHSHSAPNVVFVILN